MQNQWILGFSMLWRCNGDKAEKPATKQPQKPKATTPCQGSLEAIGQRET